jgi:hypothetical protein
LQTIDGFKQAAMAFWRELVKALTRMSFKRSAADPCLYYCWTIRVREKLFSGFTNTKESGIN